MILLADEYLCSIQIFFHKYFSFRNSLNKYLKIRYKFPFIKSFIKGFLCLIFKYLFRLFLKENYLWKNIWILHRYSSASRMIQKKDYMYILVVRVSGLMVKSRRLLMKIPTLQHTAHMLIASFLDLASLFLKWMTQPKYISYFSMHILQRNDLNRLSNYY